MTKVINIVGYTKSGKTTLVELLASEFEERNLKVGIIKSSHHKLDKEDTDTARLMKNKRIVAGFNDSETAIFYNYERNLLDIIRMIDADIILIEGAKSYNILPRVLVLKEEKDENELDFGLAIANYGKIKSTNLPNFNSENIKALADLVFSKAFLLPSLNCKACGEISCYELAKKIVAGQEDISKCSSLHTNIEILVNKKPLALNPFTANIILGSINGMLANLKGYAKGNVEIKINKPNA